MTDESEVTAESLMGDDEPEERLHPILSNEEYLGAVEAARKEVEKDRKKAAMRLVTEQEKNRLLAAGEGSLTDEDRIVDVTIDLPSFTDRVLINSQPYMNGRVYPVSIGVARTLYEQMWRCWKHDDQIDGKSMAETRARAMRRSPVLSGQDSPYRTGSRLTEDRLANVGI